MSRFVEESERKRIQRLHSIKSSLPAGGRKTKRFSSKFQKKRLSSTGTKRSEDNSRGEFQLRNTCGSSEKTRSGLRVSVAGCEEEALKANELEAMKDNVDKGNKNIRGRTRTRRQHTVVGTEGKENCSPLNEGASTYNARVISGPATNNIDSRNRTRTAIEIRAPRPKPKSLTQNTLQKGTSAPLNRNIQSNRSFFAGKSTHQNGQWERACSTSVLDSDKIGRLEGPHTKTAKEKMRRLTDRRPYANRGVTVESLENEREQANKILKDLNDANLIGRMKEMQIVMDVMNTQKRQDFAFVNASEIGGGIEESGDKDSIFDSEADDVVDFHSIYQNSMNHGRDSSISECSLSSFSECTNAGFINTEDEKKNERDWQFEEKIDEEEHHSECYTSESNWSDIEPATSNNHFAEYRSQSDGDLDSIETYDDAYDSYESDI